ncbi:MAG TPA: hypothetical protein VNO55_16550 [Polyangia bacterium]|nr:hypothetical protein [Polyangia bacterium]
MLLRHLGSVFGLIIVPALVLASTSGCVFTDPINMPPTIQIVLVPATERISRGGAAQFGAEVSDDQSEAPVVEWAWMAGSCPPVTNDRSQWPADRRRLTIFTVEGAQTKDPFCVWAAAIDRYGAATPKNYYVVPVNNPPTAAIDVLSPTQGPPYPFLSHFRLSASTSDAEMDTLTLSWKLIAQPAGSQATLSSCPENPGGAMAGTERCLDADLKGDYTVELKASDASDTTTASRTLTVQEDKLPCIDVTTPDYASGPNVHTLPAADDPEGPSRTDDFSVLRVSDDLDPWPGSGDSQLHFDWSVAKNGGDFVPQGLDLPRLSLHESQYRIGDKVRVRVQIRDRNNSEDIKNVLIGCNDADNCAVTTPNRAFGGRAGCLLRVGWTVDYR